MSGAPTGRLLTVKYDAGTENEREVTYTFEPKMTSDVTINRLRKMMIKKRSDARRQVIRDWRELGTGLDPAAQAAFAKAIVEESAKDVELSAESISEFLRSMDEDAVTTVVWCCVKEITTFEEAKKLVEAYGDTITLMEMADEVSGEEIEAEKN